MIDDDDGGDDDDDDDDDGGDDDDDDGGGGDECPDGGGSTCDFDPTNRFNCGNNLQCPYRTICDLEAAGFDQEDDCCQAPLENSGCVQIFDPVVCGDRECPYSNLCIAEESGYDRDQCTRLNSGETEASEGGEATQTMEATQAPEDIREGQKGGASKTITEILDESDDLSAFKAALDATDLTDELFGSGPFTIFAPTNEAFQRLGATNLAKLLKKKNKATLTNILVYHVVAGEIMRSDDLEGGNTLEMAQGDETVIKTKKIGATIKRKIIKINKATIVQADVKAANGVIHLIDGVLLPEEAASEILDFYKVTDLCHKPIAKFRGGRNSGMTYRMVCDSDEFNQNALRYCEMELRGVDGKAGRKVKDVCCAECGVAYSRQGNLDSPSDPDNL